MKRFEKIFRGKISYKKIYHCDASVTRSKLNIKFCWKQISISSFKIDL